MPRSHALPHSHYNTREVCELIGTRRDAIAAMVKAGTFPAPVVVNTKAGRTAAKLYLKTEVQQWLSMRK